MLSIALISSIVDSRTLLNGVPGFPCLQLGDRGIQKLRIEAGGVLTFRAAGDSHLQIRGPQLIEPTTRMLCDADRGIELRISKWHEFKFVQFPNQPAIVFAGIVRREVARIAASIEKLMPS